MQTVGPFVLGRTLGMGSTGKVKLGTHKDTGFRVAIKIVSKESLSARPSMRRKMEREIAVLKLIDHPYVMKLYDVYETSSRLFLILEHVEGGELFDYLVKRGRLPPMEALKFFQQIINGVDYCHKHLICHRDLKPENLLLDSNKKVKLADFGMASLMKKDALLATSCGSPHYASPEVVSGVKYAGESADVWSCGVILFALLTGRLPFDDDNIRRLLGKVKSGVFELPRWLSPEIKDLITRMLTVDPANRITVDEIKQHPWFISRPAEGVPVAPVEQLLAHTMHPEDLDDDSVLSLKSLGWGELAEIKARLLHPEPNLEKVFYSLLQKPKRPPYPTDDDEEEDTASGRAPMVTTSSAPICIPGGSSAPPAVSAPIAIGSAMSSYQSSAIGGSYQNVFGGGDSGSAHSPATFGSPPVLFPATMGGMRDPSPLNAPTRMGDVSGSGTSTSSDVKVVNVGDDDEDNGASGGVLAFGSPRFHRVHHQQQAPSSMTVGSPSLGSSPKRSWFASLFSSAPAPEPEPVVGNIEIEVGTEQGILAFANSVATAISDAGAKCKRATETKFKVKYETPTDAYSDPVKCLVDVKHVDEDLFHVVLTHQSGDPATFTSLGEGIAAALSL